ncbi:hypothetical protein IP91_04726 [Pseudoduganella lurida]|uniref:Uncharacterized protein n=1 Tax=Pseudoduganella lurida TaxID=1036180 RepID=A0A562QWG3_9BURK|nr:PhaM family polyhydroxyalkanoate granule multifunctional regulatory protein [Pseudoduganella lurida]TWI61139.1 hypothetical protein IP91_04726 [Pseudoduganella lurida]
MSTPQMPPIPGAAVMTDTLDFVKNLWGSMGVPGLATPTLSVDELDKKIADLKAVESWLNLNTTMLRSSIQALEVQRGTLATLKSMGQTLADSLQQKADRPDKSLFDANPYAAAFFQHMEAAQAAGSTPPKPPAAKPEPVPPAAHGLPKPDLASAAAAQMANPAAWWNLLQEQFTQAVSSAMATDGKPGGAAAPGAARPEEAKAAADLPRKPAARKPLQKKE